MQTPAFVFNGLRVIQTLRADAATFVRADDQRLLSQTTPGWKPETEVLLTDLVGSVLGVADQGQF
jgi:CRISPR/Cas system-associated protein Csm6